MSPSDAFDKVFDTIRDVTMTVFSLGAIHYFFLSRRRKSEDPPPPPRSFLNKLMIAVCSPLIVIGFFAGLFIGVPLGAIVGWLGALGAGVVSCFRGELEENQRPQDVPVPGGGSTGQIMRQTGQQSVPQPEYNEELLKYITKCVGEPLDFTDDFTGDEADQLEQNLSLEEDEEAYTCSILYRVPRIPVRIGNQKTIYDFNALEKYFEAQENNSRVSIGGECPLPVEFFDIKIKETITHFTRDQIQPAWDVYSLLVTALYALGKVAHDVGNKIAYTFIPHRTL